jgi:hypothetical protein
MIVDKKGVVTYIGRHYDEPELQRRLDTLTSASPENPGSIPAAFSLEQNYPNPFNPSTRIDYEIRVNQPTFVELAVFNLLGQKIRTLVQAEHKSGFFQAHWDGRTDSGEPAPAGVYFYSLKAGDFQLTRRMVYMR